MNTRLRELYKKAFEVSLSVDDFVLDDKEEKFAKLIIEECLAQNKGAVQSLKDNPEDVPGWKTIMNLVDVTCRNHIKEHFGID